MVENDNLLGEYVREKRKELNFTLRELSEKAEISFSQLSKIERGESSPSKNYLEQLAYALNVDRDHLLGLGGYITEDVYSDLVSQEYTTFVDREYLTRLTQDEYEILENYDNIEKLLKDIYVFYFLRRDDVNWKEEFSEDVAFIFKINAIDIFTKIDIDSRVFILQTLLNMVQSNYDNFKHFLIKSNITFTQNISRYMKTIDDFIKNNYEVAASVAEDKVFYETNEFMKIPVYGEIKAGYDSIADQNIIGYEMVAKHNISDGEYFYLKVRGDSMIDDGIVDGCMVLVRKQNHCENGKVGVVIVNGDEATLKRVYYDIDNIILQAANKRIPPRTLPIRDVMIQGQVKSYVVNI